MGAPFYRCRHWAWGGELWAQSCLTLPFIRVSARALGPWARSGTTQHMMLCCCLESEAYPVWGLWSEPTWAWSRVSLASCSPVSEMSPALRASWEMSAHADLGPQAEGAASLSLQSLSGPSPCSQHRRDRSQRALEPAKPSSGYRWGNWDPDSQGKLLIFLGKH